MLSVFKPARAAAIEETDELCDLDALQDRRVSFVLHGRRHVLLPITTERFMNFWGATIEYRKGITATAKDENVAYLAMIEPLCDTLTLADVGSMEVMQKATLITHLTSKIVGKNLTEAIEKKNIRAAAPFDLASSNSSPKPV